MNSIICSIEQKLSRQTFSVEMVFFVHQYLCTVVCIYTRIDMVVIWW